MSFKIKRNITRELIVLIQNKSNSPLVSLLLLPIIFLCFWVLGLGVVFTLHSITRAEVETKDLASSVKAAQTVSSLSSTPTLTLTLTPTPNISLTPSAPKVSLNVQAYLLGEVNKYRQSNGLSSVSSDPNTCSFARKRAQEISSNFNHEGFRNIPYPSYSKVTENIAMNEEYTRVVSNWIGSAGHAENMRADTPFVCIEVYGNYYVYEGWKP